MKNENRAVFDRTSERYDLDFDLPAAGNPPAADDGSSPEPPAGRSIIGRLIALVAGKLRERRNRLALLELSDDQLKDIGISRSQAYGGGGSRYRMSNSHALERKCR
ncbi:DUF1127 domain-containing protein [Neorhizobium sp. DT-125]|uniref:DUF1127 domain-containing protein n=1 Tax=Neorhizobium sp. DT-125 TaxID=3396163 RepID=UPI003F1BD81A